LPVPLAVVVIHGTLDTADQAQFEAVALMPTQLGPPTLTNVPPMFDSQYEQPGVVAEVVELAGALDVVVVEGWLIVKAWPPAVMTPVRVLPDVLAATM
jgi:hypothetical protein